MEKNITADQIRNLLGSKISGDQLDFLLSLRPDIIQGLMAGRLKIAYANGARPFSELVSDCELAISYTGDCPEPSEEMFPLEHVCGVGDHDLTLFDHLWGVEEYFFAPEEDGLPISKKLSLLKKRVKAMNKEAGYNKYMLCGIRRALEYVADNPQVQVDHPLVVPMLSRHPRKDLVPFFFRIKIEECGKVVYDSRAFGARIIDEVDREGITSGRAGWLLLRRKPYAVPYEFRKKDA